MTAVQQSWNLVEAEMDALGVQLFLRLFERDPALLQLFPFRDDPGFIHCKSLKVHAQAVMRTVGKLVGGLTDLQSVMPLLRKLGKSHSANLIKAETFELLREW